MRIRVYYEDTDCGNVVYYANYLKYMERSRTEHMRERGIDLADYHDKGIMFVVVEAHLYYKAPARYNDLIDIDSIVSNTSSASITFQTRICNNKKLLVKGDVRLACIGSNGRATRIPGSVLDALVEK